jgi:hypothetical protein
MTALESLFGQQLLSRSNRRPPRRRRAPILDGIAASVDLKEFS